jgi:hypothetical protein
MSDALEIIQNTFRPRRRELELMGYIVDSGRIEQVRSGRDAVVWILTPQERR